MIRFNSLTNPLKWLMALLLVAVVAGCSGGDGIPGTTTPGAGTGAGGAGRGPAPVILGTAGNFGILSKSGITDVPASPITGNIGTTGITGASITVPCSDMLTGKVFTDDANYPGAVCTSTNKLMAAAAALDMGTAYTAANSRAPDYTELGAGNIGGMTLAPATYKWGTGVLIPTDVTLSGGPNDVWIFQIAQGLTLQPGVQIKLTGGALPQNVFWATFAAASLDTTTKFNGIILSQTSIAMKTGASINGRLLAQTAVTLEQATVNQP